MGTKLHTFIDVFDEEIELKEQTIKLSKIIIPIIQRDYAQGRKGLEVERVRNRFLDSLKQAVCEKPMTLDFVYGDISEKGEMIPLDGQQRLTTLFLLHWYAAKKENVDFDEYSFLENFSYRTRFSAREFCEELVKFNPSFDKAISEEIIDQSWFPLEWQKDPTVASMLVMLDAINAKFNDVEDIWDSLKKGAISFYFLAIEDMGLTDELYIKMNSRGKPLTPFEHFKAELERSLREVDEKYGQNVATGLIRKIDEQWTDLLWQYRGDDCVIDDEFLRYFRFVCDIIYYLSDGEQQERPEDEFDIVRLFFSKNSVNVLENIKTLEKFFDCWCNLDEGTPDDFCESVFTEEHDPKKVLTGDEINIFADCLKTYADVLGNRNRRFPLNRIIILYSVVVYLTNRTSIGKEDFVRRLRMINNLVQNSPDEIRDSDNKSRMPEILKQVNSIVLTGNIDTTIKQSFNTNQMDEEIQKVQWLKDNRDQMEKLYKLEDHDLLRGQIGIVGLDNIQLADRFYELFDCDWDLVDCALITVGNYIQKEKKNHWRYQAGSASISEAWRDLFHKSNALLNQDRTKDVLVALLSSTPQFNNAILKEKTVSYIKQCEERKLFDWRYYYIKYNSMRPSSYGKYCWENFDEEPYVFFVLLTKTNFSENTFAAYFKEMETDGAIISREEKGYYLIVGDKYVYCVNDGYEIYDLETEELLKKVEIKQTEDGIDVENRVTVGKRMITDMKNNRI